VIYVAGFLCTMASASSNSLFDLTGRTALITGGGTGIGAALAKGLAEAGASVILVGRREAPLQDTCQKINAALATGDGRKVAHALPADILQFETLPDVVARAKVMTGKPVTILVNNAGVNVRQPAEKLDREHWQRSLDLMLTAPFFLARACSDGFKEERYGRVICIASLQSYQAFPDSIPYASAKSGALGLARGMAEHFSSVHGYENVTCNNIGPGYVRTELTASVFADEERAQKLADATLVGRNSEPEDLVGPTVFLASGASGYVTGQTLMVDGGFGALGMR